MLQRANHGLMIRALITEGWVSARELQEETGLSRRDVKAVLVRMGEREPIFARRLNDDRRAREYRIYPQAVQVRTR